MTRKAKIQLLLKESYLAMIKNSVGSKMFKTRYGKINNKKKDLVKSGSYRVSCAFFVSNILLFFKLIREPHLTVDGVEWDLKQSGWKKVKKIKTGSVIIWEKAKQGNTWNRHIGFFVGNNKAVSTHYKTGLPYMHNYNNRKVESIWWNSKLN